MRSTVAMNNVSIKTRVLLWHAKSWPVLCSSSVPIANSTEFMEESWIEGSHKFLKWCLSLTRLECINHTKVELSHMEALVCQHANTQDSEQEHSTRFLTFQNYFWGDSHRFRCSSPCTDKCIPGAVWKHHEHSKTTVMYKNQGLALLSVVQVRSSTGTANIPTQRTV